MGGLYGHSKKYFAISVYPPLTSKNSLWIFYRVKRMPLSRLSLFWALFLCMPFQVILSMFTNIIGNEYASNFLNLCMLLYFIFLWTIFNCEIFKMNRVFEIFMLKIFLIVTTFALMTLL